MPLSANTDSQFKEIFMSAAIDQNVAPAWLRDAMFLTDAATLLSTVLATAWEVERQVDPIGDVSLVVFSTADDFVAPTFMLFENAGQFVVATVTGDVWKGEQGFASCEQAVVAIVIGATRAETLPSWIPIVGSGNEVRNNPME
jgi:hypothetical protein